MAFIFCKIWFLRALSLLFISISQYVNRKVACCNSVNVSNIDKIFLEMVFTGSWSTNLRSRFKYWLKPKHHNMYIDDVVYVCVTLLCDTVVDWMFVSVSNLYVEVLNLQWDSNRMWDLLGGDGALMNRNYAFERRGQRASLLLSWHVKIRLEVCNLEKALPRTPPCW